MDLLKVLGQHPGSCTAFNVHTDTGSRVCTFADLCARARVLADRLQRSEHQYSSLLPDKDVYIAATSVPQVIVCGSAGLLAVATLACSHVGMALVIVPPERQPKATIDQLRIIQRGINACALVLDDDDLASRIKDEQRLRSTFPAPFSVLHHDRALDRFSNICPPYSKANLVPLCNSCCEVQRDSIPFSHAPFPDAKTHPLGVPSPDSPLLVFYRTGHVSHLTLSYQAVSFYLTRALLPLVKAVDPRLSPPPLSRGGFASFASLFEASSTATGHHEMASPVHDPCSVMDDLDHHASCASSEDSAVLSTLSAVHERPSRSLDQAKDHTDGLARPKSSATVCSVRTSVAEVPLTPRRKLESAANLYTALSGDEASVLGIAAHCGPVAAQRSSDANASASCQVTARCKGGLYLGRKDKDDCVYTRVHDNDALQFSFDTVAALGSSEAFADPATSTSTVPAELDELHVMAENAMRHVFSSGGSQNTYSCPAAEQACSSQYNKGAITAATSDEQAYARKTQMQRLSVDPGAPGPALAAVASVVLSHRSPSAVTEIQAAEMPIAPVLSECSSMQSYRSTTPTVWQPSSPTSVRRRRTFDSGLPTKVQSSMFLYDSLADGSSLSTNIADDLNQPWESQALPWLGPVPEGPSEGHTASNTRTASGDGAPSANDTGHDRVGTIESWSCMPITPAAAFRLARQPRLVSSLPPSTPAGLLFSLLLPMLLGWHVDVVEDSGDEDALAARVWALLGCGEGPQARDGPDAAFLPIAQCDALTRCALEALTACNSTVVSPTAAPPQHSTSVPQLSSLSLCALFGPCLLPPVGQAFLTAMQPFGLRRSATSVVCSTWAHPCVCQPLLGFHTLRSGVRCAVGKALSEVGSVVIVDACTRIRAESGAIGAIWVCEASAGKCVLRGVNELVQRWLFDPATGQREGPFRDTGLSGYMEGVHLYIVSRNSDLLVTPNGCEHAADVEAHVAAMSSRLDISNIAVALRRVHEAAQPLEPKLGADLRCSDPSCTHKVTALDDDRMLPVRGGVAVQAGCRFDAGAHAGCTTVGATACDVASSSRTDVSSRGPNPQPYPGMKAMLVVQKVDRNARSAPGHARQRGGLRRMLRSCFGGDSSSRKSERNLSRRVSWDSDVSMEHVLAMIRTKCGVDITEVHHVGEAFPKTPMGSIDRDALRRQMDASDDDCIPNVGRLRGLRGA